MYAYEGEVTRYQIDLTDHAFWLGTKCIDKCIEFREYGARISSEYRKIPQDKICYIPYYPITENEVAFEGYPFEFDETTNKLVFSGGQLYKTLDESNSYYKIVEYILDTYPMTKFWYAGTGDSSRMMLLMRKYPGRVALTAERRDFVNIIKKSYFYLNTFPMVGGLMMQYAASVNKVPLTLRHNNDGSGILLNQESLEIEFDNVMDMEAEIDKYFSNPDYLEVKSMNVGQAVISEHDFNCEVGFVLKNMNSRYIVKYQHENTESFRRDFIERQKKRNILSLLAKRRYWYFKHFPKDFILGRLYKILGGRH